MPKEKPPHIKKKLAKKGLSQLNRECSLEAFKHNVRREYHAGQTAQGTQHVAIALSVLRRSCGVDSKERMTPKEIVAAGQKGKTMNIEAINGLLTKAIGRIQEDEITSLQTEGKKPYDPDKHKGKYQLDLYLHNNKTTTRYYKDFKAAENGLRNAIKKDIIKLMIRRATITPPGEITWNDIIEYSPEKIAGSTLWYKDNSNKKALETFKVFSH